MHHPFLPLVLLVLAPAAYVGWRTGAVAHPVFRWTFALCAAATLAAGVAAGGVDFTYVNRLKLLLALTAGGVIIFLRPRVPGDVVTARRYRLALVALASVAAVVYLNFFGFHASGAQRTFIHLHDVAHYYLGSKYAAELDYADLYAAMLRADMEADRQRPAARQARDLRSNRLVDANVLLEDSAPIRARFSPARWAGFVRDVAFFRDALGRQFDDLFLDHGYNPTPLWTAIGGPLANLVPAGSPRGIFLLTLIDPVLLAVAFAALARTFDLETALLSMIYFCVLFGASFGWLGGAFLRYLWFAALVLAVCALERHRPLIAAALLATAAGLRIFPAILMLGPLCRWTAAAGAERRRLGRLAASFAGAGLLLAGMTVLAPGGAARWASFRANMQRHVENTAFNTIGLTQVGLGALRSLSQPADADADVAQRRTLYWGQLLFVGPLALVWFLRRARRQGEVDAAIMSLTLLFVGLNLACYYYVCLTLLVIAHRTSAQRLALLFAVEAVTYTLLLFEDRDAVVFFYRNVLVALLLAALYGLRSALPASPAASSNAARFR